MEETQQLTKNNHETSFISQNNEHWALLDSLNLRAQPWLYFRLKIISSCFVGMDDSQSTTKKRRGRPLSCYKARISLVIVSNTEWLNIAHCASKPTPSQHQTLGSPCYTRCNLNFPSAGTRRIHGKQLKEKWLTIYKPPGWKSAHLIPLGQQPEVCLSEALLCKVIKQVPWETLSRRKLNGSLCCRTWQSLLN